MVKGLGSIHGSVALVGRGRLIQSERSRTVVYVSQRVVSDSLFPFRAGEEVVVRIEPDKQRLVIEKADAGRSRSARK